jgi:hypothetical protein
MAVNFEALKSKKVLVLIGKAGAGKDTVAGMIYDMVSSPRPHAFRFSEPLKELCETVFGWSAKALGDLNYKEEVLPMVLKRIDGSSMRTRREVLQYIGTDVFRTMDPEVWISAALRIAAGRASMFDCSGFICTDCRFPNELEALKKHFGEIRVVRLVKDNGSQITSSQHASERMIDSLPFDETHAIEAGNFDGLRACANSFSQFFKNPPTEDIHL